MADSFGYTPSSAVKVIEYEFHNSSQQAEWTIKRRENRTDPWITVVSAQKDIRYNWNQLTEDTFSGFRYDGFVQYNEFCPSGRVVTPQGYSCRVKTYIKIVQKQYKSQYSVTGRIVKTVRSRYVLGNIIVNAIPSQYSIRKTIQDITPSHYSIRNKIAKSFWSAYRIIAVIQKNIPSHYSIQGRVGKIVASQYSIRNKIAKSVISRYIIRENPPYEISSQKTIHDTHVRTIAKKETSVITRQ